MIKDDPNCIYNFILQGAEEIDETIEQQRKQLREFFDALYYIDDSGNTIPYNHVTQQQQDEFTSGANKVLKIHDKCLASHDKHLKKMEKYVDEIKEINEEMGEMIPRLEEKYNVRFGEITRKFFGIKD